MSNSAALQQIDIIKIYEKKRCLIVDDLTEVRAAYKRMLRSFGATEIDTAASGDQAMELCQARQYDIIICDYNLDESKDGQQVLEELRHMQLLKYTTLFVIITAETAREMVLGAIENQPDDYITKPISQKMMRTRLDRALLKHEMLYEIKAAMDSQNYDQALELCDDIITKQPRIKWECMRYKAQIYWMMQNGQAAQKMYQQAADEKDFVWAKIGLARTLLEAEQYDEIETILKGILRDDHRYIEAHDLLSEFYEKTQQMNKAQEATKTATELSPKSILRHRRLAELAEENQDDDTCLAAYEEAIRWNYNSCHASPEDYLNMARKTVGMTKGKKDRQAADKNKRALSLLERMSRRFPERRNKVKSGFIECQLHFNQGKERLAKSTLANAEAEFDLLEPKDYGSRLDCAEANILCGDKDKAYQELHTVAEENKHREKVLHKVDKISDEPISTAGKQCAARLSRRGIQAYQNKDYDQSLTVFKDALKMFPNHIGVNLNMVQVALAKSEHDGISEALYRDCSNCLLRVANIDPEHKQFERYQFLNKQYTNLYKDLAVET